jgi:hypothetical protein
LPFFERAQTHETIAALEGSTADTRDSVSRVGADSTLTPPLVPVKASLDASLESVLGESLCTFSHDSDAQDAKRSPGQTVSSAFNGLFCVGQF